MNRWSQKSHKDHLGNLPVQTTTSPVQPVCASPLLTGVELHPWLTAIPKIVFLHTPQPLFQHP